MHVRIYPLNTGFIRLDRGAYITPGQGHGEAVDVPAWAFLITDGREKILVDTGMCDTERANWHHPGSYQPQEYRIDRQLEKIGMAAHEVDSVIFTHLHWDHCSNMMLFKNARYYVHSRELQFALDPHVLYYKSYESKRLGVTPPFEGAQFETVSGECEYSAFVNMFPTPGHSPGHQSVAVKTNLGVHVIAGDAIFSDENLRPDSRRNFPFTPMGRYVDIIEMFDSMERILERADHVLTGHGAANGVKSIYP